MKSNRATMKMPNEGRARRIAARLVLVVLFAALLLPFTSFGVRAEGESGVYDYQGLLDSDEIQELTSRFHAFEREHGIRMFLMTPGVAEVGGYDDEDSVRFIEAFVDQKVDDECIGLLVNMDTRYLYIDYHGEKTIQSFTDDKQYAIEEAVVECLYSDDIHSAGLALAEEAERLIYTEEQPTKSESSAGNATKGGVTAGVVGLVGSLGMMGSKSRKHREKKIATNADVYADEGSLALTLNRDNFSHQYVTRVARTQNNRGGLGGGHTTTHRSLGGHTHSGGGRRF